MIVAVPAYGNSWFSICLYWLVSRKHEIELEIFFIYSPSYLCTFQYLPTDGEYRTH